MLPPWFRETRPCCPNSDSICLWWGRGPELPNGTNGSEKGSDCRKKPAFGLMTDLEEVGRTTEEKQNFLRYYNTT